jgi:hypothetical protein
MTSATGESVPVPEPLFTLKPGDDLTIRYMGGLRMVHCDRITPEGAVFRDLTPAEADGEVIPACGS